MAEIKNMTPSEYFEAVKAKISSMKTEDIDTQKQACLELATKYKITKQILALNKMLFVLESLDKELALNKLGFDKFVYRQDIEEFIDDISGNPVKIIELENYEREIPDEIVENIVKTQDIFDVYYVLYTDYTGKSEKKIENKRRDKDPILFGAFKDDKKRTMIDRFYFLGDWIDEYCDLTLDQMVAQFNKKGKSSPVKSIINVNSAADLSIALQELIKEKNGTLSQINDADISKIAKNKGILEKIKSVFRK
ncbi:MAG: hypothetical protein ACRCX2_35600 [Paraclostridium sp.]